MKQHLLIGLGVIVIVIVSFYLFSAGRVAAPENSVPAAETAAENNATNTSAEASSNSTTENPQATQQNTKTESTPRSAPVAKPQSTPTSVQQPTAPAISLPRSVVVVYDGGRFIPEKVTVIEGGTVRFLNTGDQDMWVASDNHPTHTRYPTKDEGSCSGQSFDQCTAVGNGESWGFVFTRLGTWGYHNHERARDTGSVRVMTEEAYIEEMTSGI